MRLIALIFTFMGFMTLAACSDGPAEEAGENIDNAAEEVMDATEDAAEEACEAVGGADC
ncbi:hypothetical protein QGM61_10945 [Pseudohongiella sp. SYSU M77423]|uniref:hypothetical protein n=1 Tax=unclassified Pseudohongiella TaxID=2629611 RepID=UPI001F2EDB1B|nr:MULTISPECIES: hypothetical protein [unclassified Pseudohongiella]MDH7944337.1 hypothetical protein [Pseudohongiella sp. SYSU M77423]|tara:strand:+ start:1745 stop:1921 length:177 start_codon:yes stop_codon:yes gene_type:complete